MSIPVQSITEEPSFIICLQNADGTLNMAAVKHMEAKRAWEKIKKEVSKLPEIRGQ